MKKRGMVAGIGSALVDILVRAGDDFLETIACPKGGMRLVDAGTMEAAVKKAPGKPAIVPGGSACNTIIGVARLGGAGRFVGKRGPDALGDLFESELRRNGVEALLAGSRFPTGRVLSVITPDAQRTMLTYLGAAERTLPGEVTPDCFAGADIAHIEGYMAFNPDLIRAAMASARAAGARICLDLASFTVVEAAGPLLRELIAEYVDILIANEDEARVYTGAGGEAEALDRLRREAAIAVLKVGARGSHVADADGVYRIAPMKPGPGDGPIVDTTGAGDLWAAGFLYGLVNGWPPEKCGALGSACGYAVCQVVGAAISDSGWERIHAYIETELEREL